MEKIRPPAEPGARAWQHGGMAPQPATLRAILSALRDPEYGCPWDLEQDHHSLARFLREETAEVLDALASHEPGAPDREAHLREELGDLWLQVVFHAQLAEERGAFDLHEVERGVVDKLIRRHPHVFGEVSVTGSEDVLVNWRAIKAEEKAQQGQEQPKGVLDRIPHSLSPMEEAMEIGRACAKVGFEWPDLEGVLDKVVEEVRELQAETERDRVEAEFGDVLFSLCQWARKKGIDPDLALRRQMTRFRSRFQRVEQRAQELGGWEGRTLAELDAAWEEAKRA